MHRAGFLKSSVLVDIVNYGGVPLLAIYFLSMFAYPWFATKGSWEQVQLIWDRWQSLNTGALAFLASLLAFNISRFNENRQREREFVAARAFLPSTLSSLMEYCTRSAGVLRALWETTTPAAAALENPALPTDYREVFSNCIRHADPEVGSYLSKILVQLQIQDARLHDAISQSASDPGHPFDRSSLIAYIYRLGETYALVANVFEFARGERIFDAKGLTWENLRSAYWLLEFKIEDISISETMSLEAFTKRRLERTNGNT